MCSTLSAHQKKEAITRVIFNERLMTIEIIHRFSVHDAEHGVKKLFGKSADLIDDKKSQAQFADYVMQNFSMIKNVETALVLTSVGFEVDGRYLWVYQETALQSDISELSITHNALRDIWHDQVNLLNVERDKKVRSLIFRGSLDPQTIQFNDL
ncbi:MAG: hypothetical protein COA74_04660 [Gammaproteobacteria bacterium]|nr:MAG: hypothetical protein COA74_04660 [Gammaproteobacteria bacterium]